MGRHCIYTETEREARWKPAMLTQPLIKEKVAEKLTFVIFIVIPGFFFCSSYSVISSNAKEVGDILLWEVGLHHDDYNQFSTETFYI